jgi:hypothetical protein
MKEYRYRRYLSYENVAIQTKPREMSIPRVNSSASELNDFTESEGKKIYHVRVIV